MRVGIFTDMYIPYVNGVSTSIVMLKKGLEELGHQVYVVAMNPNALKYKTEENNTIIRLPAVTSSFYDYRISGTYSLKATRQIKKWNLDVIHTQTEFGIGTFARVISQQFDIPLVHTYHTYYEEYIKYITKGHFDSASKKIVRMLTDFYCDTTIDELIVPTKKIYELFKQKYRFKRDVHIIPTGIEIKRFYKENQDKKALEETKKRLGLKATDFIMLYLGRLGFEKNVNYLIEVQKEIVKKQKNAKLIIVGAGPDLPKFQEMTKQLDLEESVIFAGRVPWEETAIYYNIADIFVDASLTETQGLTIIEAMAASLPIIAIDDDCFRNIVIEGENGYIFKTKEEYQEIVNDLVKNKQKCQELGKKARITSQEYSYEIFAKRVLAIYKKAIKENPQSKTILSRLGKIVRTEFNE